MKTHRPIRAADFAAAMLLLTWLATSPLALGDTNATPAGVERLAGAKNPASVLPSDRLRVYKFWATWCSVCRAEMPKFNELHQRLGDRVDVVAVNVATDDPKPDVLEAIDELQMNMPVWYDGEQRMWDGYGLKGTPSYVVLDADGNPLGQWAGEWPEDMVALLEAHACDSDGEYTVPGGVGLAP